jgi:hypothetical protein
VQADPLGDASGWRGMLVVETIGRIRREHFVRGRLSTPERRCIGGPK